MTDRSALLRAIRESPGDVAPRLAYADWLRDHGEPDLADLIRGALAQPIVCVVDPGDEVAAQPAPNAVGYMVRLPGEQWEPMPAVGAVLRFVPFDYLPGYPIRGVECERSAGNADRWRVVVFYERPTR
jgi:uncharacterized protein (TIGR02996 family)